jgi:hypothetical protein
VAPLRSCTSCQDVIAAECDRWLSRRFRETGSARRSGWAHAYVGRSSQMRRIARFVRDSGDGWWRTRWWRPPLSIHTREVAGSIPAAPISLWIAPRRGAFGHEPSEAGAVAGHEVDERVDERRQPQGAKKAPERTGQADLGEEPDSSALVAGNEGAVAEDEPPTLAARFLRNVAEQTAGFLVREREQCQLLATIERGDDPRRPAAEVSAAGIEHDRARKAAGRSDTRAQVTRHESNDP